MTIRLVIDMNLSAEWIGEFAKQSWQAVHWSSIGDPRADDHTIMTWAIESGFVVFTHDLDFGATLAYCRYGAKRDPSPRPIRIARRYRIACRRNDSSTRVDFGGRRTCNDRSSKSSGPAVAAQSRELMQVRSRAGQVKRRKTRPSEKTEPAPD
jgi:hypothetical protein